MTGRNRVMANDRASHASTWSPLWVPRFRALWLAGLASNVGTWMQ